MFMSDVHKKDEIRAVASQDLRKLGIKCRPKKPKHHAQQKNGTKVFKVALSAVPSQTVTLRTGQQIVVPKLVHEMCSFILAKADVEGVFRKEGSKARQNEIKLSVDRGCHLDPEYHVIDVAVVLKTFLRELPEPLIPYGYHELFLRCMLLEEKHKLDAVFLACLLLPIEHLNTLSYLMQFFKQISEQEAMNKMNTKNLAIVIGPTVFPVEEKLSPNPQLRTTKTCELLKLLIENASIIGVLSENIIERIGSSQGLDHEDAKKKKRRSGSLTRMFNGLKKMVGGKTCDDSSNIVTPDLLLTPINSAVKKRRNLVTHGISNKKKKEIVKTLPENTLLSTPFTPRRTPVNMNINGPSESLDISHEVVKEKKTQWFSKSRSTKSLKQEPHPKRPSVGPRALLERRWSAASQFGNNSTKTKKKRNSCAATLAHQKLTVFGADLSYKVIYGADEEIREVEVEEIQNVPIPEPDYIRVSKEEYEEIKNRVSDMERRISTFELETVQSNVTKQESIESRSDTTVGVSSQIEQNNIRSVQTAYEQTLDQVEPMSPTTDQLAKRLSKELKIRRSIEQRIIRSPSARKIGSMRRRSRETDRNNSRLTRHQSWHSSSRDAANRPVNIKRSKPVSSTNVSSKLSNPTRCSQFVKNSNSNVLAPSSMIFDKENDQVRPDLTCDSAGSSSSKWTSAEGFFATVSTPSSNLSDRASIAKLRSQNAGMVLAKAKLFDGLRDTGSADLSEDSSHRMIPRPRLIANTAKIGTSRNANARMSYRVRTLKSEDRRLAKKSMSPRRRHQVALLRRKEIEAEVDKENASDNCFRKMPLKDCNREMPPQSKEMTPKFSTPRTTPYIKRVLNVKSPKRLCRTPAGMERSTPLKVLTPAHHL